MSFLSAEIRSQPSAWRRAASLPADQRPALPAPGERVAVVGCGTSWFMAQAFAHLREAGGHGQTDAFAASEMPRDRRYDRVVCITRSGTTTEVLALLDELRPTGARTVAITADGATPVVGAADEAIVLDFADERSVVQTVFATTTLALLRSHVGEDIEPLAAAAEAALVAPPEPRALRAEQLTFVGRGAAVGLAHEAALKLREATQSWTESYPAMEYRHGPISIAAPGRAVWALGPQPAGLAADIEATGADLIAHEGEDAMVTLVRVHVLTEALAGQRGLDPDRPRHLTRSVMLAP